MTQAIEDEVKTPENIHLADNPLALHGILDAASETVIHHGPLLGFQPFLSLSHWFYQQSRNSNSGLE